MKLCHAHTSFLLLCMFLYVVVKAIRSFCMELQATQYMKYLSERVLCV